MAPNAWIRIHGDGRIQLVLARSEMGQGVMTALPMLLAEELEVGLDQIEVEPAPVDPAYVNRLLGEQATGDSTSVREAWIGLREAGAVARALLVGRRAATWRVPESECQARRGRVHHADGMRSLSYGELAATAARLPVPEQVPLKAPHDWTLIGTRQRRLDTPDKVAGRARFGLDVRLPGMLYATIERCPVLGSRCAAGAATRPARSRAWSMSWRFAMASPWSPRRPGRALRGRAGAGGRLPARPPTARRTPTHPRPSAHGSERARRAGAQAGRCECRAGRRRHQIEAVYEVPFQAHACMEPMNCTADVGPDRCAIHVPTQAQQGALETARRLTGLPAERISVHTTLLGGGFGRRREQDFVADAVELSKRLGRPVQVIWTREDDIRHDFYRPMTLHRLRGGIDREGNLVAWFHRIVGPSVLARLRPVRRSATGSIRPLVAGAVDLPYAIPTSAGRIPARRHPGAGGFLAGRRSQPERLCHRMLSR